MLEDAVAFTGVARYPARIKCALLGWMAWKDAALQASALHSDPNSDPNNSTATSTSEEPA